MHEQKVDCQRPVMKPYEEDCFSTVNQFYGPFNLFNAYSPQKFLQVFKVLLGNLQTHVPRCLKIRQASEHALVGSGYAARFGYYGILHVAVAVKSYGPCKPDYCGV